MNDVTIKISEVSILPIKPKQGHIGFLSFVLNNQFYVGDVAIYTRPNGDLRLVYPSKTLPNGKSINVFHPITQLAGQHVLKEAEDALNRLGRHGDE